MTPGRRHTAERGGLQLGGDRWEPAFCRTISKITIFRKGLLGFTKTDQQSMRPLVACGISDILQSEVAFCQQPATKLQQAVRFREAQEPRLAVCEASWDACALLSRSLRCRKLVPGPRRRRQAERVDPATAGESQRAGGAAAAALPSQELLNQ